MLAAVRRLAVMQLRGSEHWRHVEAETQSPVWHKEAAGSHHAELCLALKRGLRILMTNVATTDM